MYRVFVDGQEGTTGLEIRDRLVQHGGIEILTIEPTKRKDPKARQEMLNAADVAFLCLPDVAARESASLVSNRSTVIIDASTAHRVDPRWVYGLPELNKNQRTKIRSSNRISVPGCHATGFILAMHPLVSGGIVPADYPVTCHSVSGYSGAGKSAISEYEGSKAASLAAPRLYALSLDHKHLPEMRQIVGLCSNPIFTPMIDDFYKGMAVSIPLYRRMLRGGADARDVHACLASYYESEAFVKIMPLNDTPTLEGRYLDILASNDTNRMDIYVWSNEDQILLVSRLDNLGKGASGAAIQNMNIVLGVDESTGLG